MSSRSKSREKVHWHMAMEHFSRKILRNNNQSKHFSRRILGTIMSLSTDAHASDKSLSSWTVQLTEWLVVYKVAFFLILKCSMTRSVPDHCMSSKIEMSTILVEYSTADWNLSTYMSLYFLLH